MKLKLLRHLVNLQIDMRAGRGPRSRYSELDNAPKSFLSSFRSVKPSSGRYRPNPDFGYYLAGPILLCTNCRGLRHPRTRQKRSSRKNGQVRSSFDSRYTSASSTIRSESERVKVRSLQPREKLRNNCFGRRRRAACPSTPTAL